MGNEIMKMLEGGLSMLVAGYILNSTNAGIEDDGQNKILYLDVPYAFNNGGDICFVEAIYLSRDMELSLRLDYIGKKREQGSLFVSPTLSVLQYLYLALGLENDEVDDFRKAVLEEAGV